MSNGFCLQISEDISNYQNWNCKSIIKCPIQTSPKEATKRDFTKRSNQKGCSSCVRMSFTKSLQVSDKARQFKLPMPPPPTKADNLGFLYLPHLYLHGEKQDKASKKAPYQKKPLNLKTCIPAISIFLYLFLLIEFAAKSGQNSKHAFWFCVIYWFHPP